MALTTSAEFTFTSPTPPLPISRTESPIATGQASTSVPMRLQLPLRNLQPSATQGANAVAALMMPTTPSGNLPGVSGYPRVHVDFGVWLQSEENRTAGALLLEAIQLRAKYLAALEQPPPPPIVMQQPRKRSASSSAMLLPPPPSVSSSSLLPASTSAWSATPAPALPTPTPSPVSSPPVSRSPSPQAGPAIPNGDEFVRDYDRLLEICATGPVITFAHKRLHVLEYSFNFHRLLNSKREMNATKYTPNDSSTIVRVDTHVHLAAAMSENHLLEFILRKLETCPNEIVLIKDGTPLTLRQVFDRLGLDATRLSVHSLDVRAGTKTFNRFDQFNSLYNPFGVSDLRTIFLKVNNYQKGKYLAELTKELFSRVESTSKKTEFRISIYGRSREEWDDLAKWVKRFNVVSPSNRWLIQVPRIYSTLRHSNTVLSFAQLLDNIFGPLLAVTEDPSSNPDLDSFLKSVSGFDSVDDESRVDLRLEKQLPDPETWTSLQNPPYMYYMYFMWKNIAILNQRRRAKGLGTFDFRPHAGESGSERHLAAAFLTSTAINHGVNLEKLVVLEYLFYLCKIGVCVSPLSNNSLFLNYSGNPFNLFFMRGLNVSLSTDDPLQFHYTQTPLLEEYAIASRFWKLTEVDLAEIARNSVLHSGFPDELKAKWLGPQFKLPGTAGNDPFRTNVPMIRCHFRNHCFEEEVKMLLLLSSKGHSSPPPTSVVPSPITGSGYAAITISGAVLFRTDEANEEVFTALPMIAEALALRDKYWIKCFDRAIGEKFADSPGSSDHSFSMRDGVILLYPAAALCFNDQIELATVHCAICGTECCQLCDDVLHRAPGKRTHVRTAHQGVHPLYAPISFEEYVHDYSRLCEICSSGPARSVCWRRLHLLEERFHFHTLIHDTMETDAVKSSGTDFYRVCKVDTHVHINRSMTSTQLLRFIKHKLITERDRVVCNNFRGRSGVKLGELFELLGLRDRNLNLDALNVRADQDTFMRFDSWVAKYTPFGKPELRELFLKTYNDMGGRYLAELLQETTFRQLTITPSLRYEMRISISGNSPTEFSELAHWVLANKLQHPSNRWLVQIPRVYPLVFKDGHVKSFGQLLENLFLPLFEATKNPDDPRYAELSTFLFDVSGFDTVGDESTIERSLDVNLPRPQDWKTAEQPPFAYWLYYLNANIQSLNNFRRTRRLNVFDFRPHTGESGDVFHLAAAFLTAKHINHGLQLMNHPTLQYLYYVAQIGLAAAPLSESTLHLAYEADPFPVFFKRGLNVSLSTDNPLQLHITPEPLIEEYATASQMWKFSVTDMCEIARNSVLQSGFSYEERERWIGRFWRDPIEGNDVSRTNVPNVRLRFRRDTYLDEVNFIRQTERSASEMSSLLCMI